MSQIRFHAARSLRVASSLLAVSLLSAPALTAGVFPNGVNLQPTYYNGGNVNFGWSLMNANSKIKTCRLEIDPTRGVSMSQMKSWISQVKSNGKTLICTYHQFGGSDSTANLNTAANWWRSNYSTLNSAGSFTVNVCNEWGSHNISASSFASAYNNAIGTVRQVYSGRIIVDISGWGQETHIANLALKGSGTRIGDSNIVLSAHIYAGGWNQFYNRSNIPWDMDDLALSGKPCILGEFGTGPGSTNWSGIVDRAKALGFTVLGWAWNGDGGSMNMCNPSWASNSTATSFGKSSYFNTIYNKL
jgi:mannan endo-1,4-beta-mannosidase